MKLLQEDLLKKKKDACFLYRIQDLKCKSLVLSGFKNNIKDNIYYKKNDGSFQKVNIGYWVWLDKQPIYIFWLSNKQFLEEFSILYCYSNVIKPI